MKELLDGGYDGHQEESIVFIPSEFGCGILHLDSRELEDFSVEEFNVLERLHKKATAEGLRVLKANNEGGYYAAYVPVDYPFVDFIKQKVWLDRIKEGGGND